MLIAAKRGDVADFRRVVLELSDAKDGVSEREALACTDATMREQSLHLAAECGHIDVVQVRITTTLQHGGGSTLRVWSQRGTSLRLLA